MTRSVPGAAFFATILTLPLLLSACALTEPTNFYTLSALGPQMSLSNTKSAPAAGSDVAVGVGPVTIPSYLERPEIVLRVSDNRMVLSEFDNWIEPLDSMVPRILAENVSRLLASDQVFVLPQRRSLSLDYRAEIDLLRFEAYPAGGVELDVHWWIYTGDEEQPLRRERTRYVESLSPGAGPAEVAAAMSSALAALSRALADAIIQPTL